MNEEDGYLLTYLNYSGSDDQVKNWIAKLVSTNAAKREVDIFDHIDIDFYDSQEEISGHDEFAETREKYGILDRATDHCLKDEELLLAKKELDLFKKIDNLLGKVPDSRLSANICKLLIIWISAKKVIYSGSFLVEFMQKIIKMLSDIHPDIGLNVLDVAISSIWHRSGKAYQVLSEKRLLGLITTIKNTVYRFDKTHSLFWSPWKRPMKERIRHLVAQSTPEGVPSALLFPGSTGRDLQLLVDYGCFDLDTEIYMIERNQKEYEKFLDNYTFSPLDFGKAFIHRGDLESFNPTQPINFAWFDFCGGWSPDKVAWLLNYSTTQLTDTRWLEEYGNTLINYDGPDTTNLNMWFTFNYFPRGNKFFNDLKKFCTKINHGRFNDIISNLTYTTPGIKASIFEMVAVHLLLLETCLPHLNFFCDTYVYSDDKSSLMLTFGLSEFSQREKPRPWPYGFKRIYRKYIDS
jgi:hypothetical protein